MNDTMDSKSLKQYILLQIAKYGPSRNIRRNAFGAADLVSLGSEVSLGPGVTTTPTAGCEYGETLIHIGDRVTIGPNVSFICSSHPNESKLSAIYGGVDEIVVDDDVWIGADVTILRGVQIGARSVISAGAVVEDDVEPDTVVGGVPAMKLKDIDCHSHQSKSN